MKLMRIFTLCLAILTMLCLGCGGNSADKKASVPTVTKKAQASESNYTGNSKILIVYFSHSGNTQRLANMFQAATGADMFRVETVKPYSKSYHAVLNEAKQEQQNNARPELVKLQADNFAAYETVFIGYPNWWNSMPMALFTFLEANDTNGKKIIPFATHEGGAFGQSIGDLKKLAPNANVVDGFEVRGGLVSDAEADVAKFVQGLGLAK